VKVLVRDASKNVQSFTAQGDDGLLSPAWLGSARVLAVWPLASRALRSPSPSSLFARHAFRRDRSNRSSHLRKEGGDHAEFFAQGTPSRWAAAETPASTEEGTCIAGGGTLSERKVIFVKSAPLRGESPALQNGGHGKCCRWKRCVT